MNLKLGTILITGTSKGIGNYLAQNLSEDFEVFGVARSYSTKNPPSLLCKGRSKKGDIFHNSEYSKIASLDQAQFTSSGSEGQSLKDTSKCITELSLDLTNFSQFDAFCEEFDKKDIKFEHIIFNAGVGAFGRFEGISPEKYEEIINLNLLSPILSLQKLLPFLEKKGKIIFVGSIAGKKFLKYGTVYQASKFGIRGFAGALKNELGNRVHIINPKLVETDFHKESSIKIDVSPEKITSLQSILETVQEILSGKEKRFEIDL